MLSSKPIGQGSTRVRRRARRGLDQDAGNEARALGNTWRRNFLSKLAETSNVRYACDYAGVNPTTVYDLRRRDPGFQQRWLDALCEGYDNLEMEMLHALRRGEGKDSPKYNFAVALRMLQAHRDTVGREKARRIDVDVEQVRASIALKFEKMRDRVLARRAREAEAAAAEDPAAEARDGGAVD